MTGTAVAAGFTEQAHDVPLEIDFLNHAAVRQRDVGGMSGSRQEENGTDGEKEAVAWGASWVHSAILR